MKPKFAVYLAGIIILLACGIDKAVHTPPSALTLQHFIAADPEPVEERAPVELLQQKFTYLGKGTQVYVFLGEDQKTVLKLFKAYRLQPTSWLCHLPWKHNPFFQIYKKRELRKETLFRSMHTAYQHFPEETGLLYVSLKTHEELPSVEIVTFDGRSLFVDLNHTAFALQKRAVRLYAAIAERMHVHDTKGAEAIIQALFDTFETLGKNGVVDNDPCVEKNMGYLNERVILMDTGRFRIAPDRINNPLYKKDLFNHAQKLRGHLEKNHPELVEFFHKCLESKMQ